MNKEQASDQQKPKRKKQRPVISTWPEDTVIFIQQLIVELDMSEIESLGFQVIDSSDQYRLEKYGSISYKNKFRGKTTSFYRALAGTKSTQFGLTSEIPVANNKPFTHHSFYPIMTGGTSFIFHNKPKNAIDAVYLEEFENYRHQIVPIKIKGNALFSVSEGLFFLVTPELFDHLPERYQILKSTFQNIQAIHEKTGRKVILYHDDILESTKKIIHLERNELDQLGFHFGDTAIELQVRYQSKPTIIYINRKKDAQHGFIRYKNLDVLNDTLIDTRLGLNNVSDFLGSHQNDQMFIQDYDFKVPIILEQVMFPEYLIHDKYFWFDPSDSLFARLPQSLREELTSDYHYITTRDKSLLEANCTFFTICEEQLKLLSFDIILNSKTNSINVCINLTDDLKATISIYDLHGQLLLRPIEGKQYFKGNNQEKINIRQLMKGNYKITISTENGYKSQYFDID